MSTIPRPTIDAIYAHYDARDRDSGRRTYLGGSAIGAECARSIWLDFRHASDARPEGRMLRLFQTGHREEARLIDDLRAIGCEVLDRDPSTGEQWRYTDGHLSCGLDGVVRGLKEAPETWHLLEIKTANRKSFDECERVGVEKWRPKYFAQAQLYMSFAELTRCAFFVVCKDDDRIYMERIKADPMAAKAIRLKAARIIAADDAPDRISEDPAFYQCKLCLVSGVCWGSAMPLVSCRTCVHAKAETDGTWSCAREFLMEPGCSEHILIPAMIPWAEPIDGAPDWIRYRVISTGREFVNATQSSFPAKASPHYSSRELVAMTPAAVGHPTIDLARRVLGDEVVESRQLSLGKEGAGL